MYIYFILHLDAIYTFDFCYFIYKKTKTGNIFKKAKCNFFDEYKYGAYLLNQHRQLTNGINVCGDIFC